ncbi:MAG: ThuA domain-containing protein, partial [Saprospiraceae bacterium]|nr:ThuA domain-containing protein [Saprospiraceae bacterium]
MKNIALALFAALLALGAYTLLKNTDQPLHILIFSKTASFRHESIESGVEAIKKLGTDLEFEVDATEDASIFNEMQLKDYQVIVFLNTTGDILDGSQQAEMERWIQAGGGFVGVHAAADTEYDWPWYGKLVGAYFNGHPNNPNVRDATVQRVDHNHASTKHLPEQWARTDEWYNYKDINADINILLNLDESSYEGGTNGDNHPIAWYHEYDGGLSWYTGGGHTIESFEDPDFMEHLLQGILYAAGDGKPVNYSRSNVAPESNRFQKVVLEDHLNEPMELVMLPDQRILFIERRGDIHVFDPAKGKSEVAAHLDVHSVYEDGLLGVALDPNYQSNHWIYLFYSPVGDDPIQHISRFLFKDDSLYADSEEVLLEINVQRDECCHSAGSLEFGPDGHLFISVGDNTNPHASDGYAPIDERPGRNPWDAQKSSANTNDLRGKILRIKPESDGTYSIPEGNLFAKDGSEGRPEIYVMGCRNPYRISIDPQTKYLYWGDVGPDAGNDSIGRGPRGHDEVNQARQPGFFGWPYFVGDNKAYTDYDFETQLPGEMYDPSRPVNRSANNTGAEILPPAQSAFIWYPYARSPEFPSVGDGGRNAMAGPIFYHEDYPDNPNRYPKYFDKKLFIYDWMRGWIMTVEMDDEGNFGSMERFIPEEKFNNPNDMIMS